MNLTRRNACLLLPMLGTLKAWSSSEKSLPTTVRTFDELHAEVEHVAAVADLQAAPGVLLDVLGLETDAVVTDADLPDRPSAPAARTAVAWGARAALRRPSRPGGTGAP